MFFRMMPRLLGLALLGLLIAACGGASQAADDDLIRMIREAGNARHEADRYRILAEIDARPDIDPPMRADLDKILPIVRQWAVEREPVKLGKDGRSAENGYLTFFYSPIRKNRQTPNDDYPPKIDPDSPLYPIYALYRGRMLIWYPIQVGQVGSQAELRPLWFGEGRRLLEIAREAFPDNPVLGMYFGELLPWPSEYPDDPEAPKWANLQRRGLEKWTDVVHWWIDERQLDTGEFGGGWGDDVEMWRRWTPMLIAFKDPKVEAGMEKMAQGIFAMPHMARGFTERMTDAEHASEDTADTITPMMHIRPGDEVWSARAQNLIELMRENWTGVNERGELQFKSAYLNVEGTDSDPEKAYDTVYHARTMQPALLYWQRTGDVRAGEVFSRWMQTWVSATNSTDGGKPAGVTPAVIHWPDGRSGSVQGDWWRINMYGSGLYTFPSALDEFMPAMLLTWWMTEDDRFLEPIVLMANLRRQYHEGTLADEGSGSPAWCGRKIGGAISAVLPKYRFLTGDKSFDDLIREDGNAYVRYRIDGDMEPLINSLRSHAMALNANFEAYTSEVRWTDRLLAFRKYLGYHDEDQLPGPSIDTLYQSASGDPGQPYYFPLNAVRWLTEPREIAALVKDSGPSRLEAELYHFGESARAMQGEFFLLRPGSYRLSLKVGPAEIASEVVLITMNQRTISFDLPSRKVVRLTLEPMTGQE